MGIRCTARGRVVSLILGMVTLADVVLLLVLDANPSEYSAANHAVLAAFALGMIAFAYLIFQWAKRSRPSELAKAILLAAAFLFWAANQFWPALPQAGLFNDIAIGLFVLDVFLVISGWPQAPVETSIPGYDPGGEAARSSGRCCCRCDRGEHCC